MLLLLACARTPPAPPPVAAPEAHEVRTDVKAPGNLPVLTESELAAEDATRQSCIEACAEDAGCEQACMEATPVRQVEVVPDLMPMPVEE